MGTRISQPSFVREHGSCGSEEGSCLRLIDFCITQLQA